MLYESGHLLLGKYFNTKNLFSNFHDHLGLHILYSRSLEGPKSDQGNDRVLGQNLELQQYVEMMIIICP